MRISGLVVAVVALALLGGGLYWSNKVQKEKEKAGASTDTNPKVVSMPEDQIQQVEIKKKDVEPTVVKRGNDGKWQLVAPKPTGADQDAVNSMMSTLASLSSDRLVEEKAADLATFGLHAPALEVIITKKDGKTEKVLVGDETPTGSGAFVKTANDPRVFTIAGYNKSSFDKTWSDLRDKRLLTFDQDKLTRVELNAKGQSIEFGKNNKNEWTILEPKPLRADGFQVEELIRKLKDARMDTSISEEDAKKAGSSFAAGQPVAVAKVTDAAGTQQIEVRKNKDDYYARSSVLEGVHKIGSDFGQGLDKGLDDFRNKKLFDFGFNEPNRVEVKTAAQTINLQKSGEKWNAGQKQMDSTSVQNLIDKLRDFSSTKFVEQAFAASSIEVTVSYNDGKSTEKVLIARAGGKAFAKRDGEPAVYEVDPAAVDEIEKAAGEVKEAQPAKDEKKK
jgi:hypothetical protein